MKNRSSFESGRKGSFPAGDPSHGGQQHTSGCSPSPKEEGKSSTSYAGPRLSPSEGKGKASGTYLCFFYFTCTTSFVSGFFGAYFIQG